MRLGGINLASFTKTAIKQSFLKLLEQKPLSRITVKDIVEDCGINRNSFYYHFADIPSLVEEIMIEQADKIIAQYPSVDSLEECMNASLQFAERNKRPIMHIYNCDRPLFEQHLWKVCEYMVTAYGNTAFAKRDIDEYDKKTLISLYKCECFGVVIDWINGGMKDDIHRRVKRIYELRKDASEQSLDRCRKASG